MNSSVTGQAAGQATPRVQVESVSAPHQSPPVADFETAREDVRKVVEKMQEQFDSMNVSLQYSTYGDHGEKIAIAVVNKETGELIREIPSKELQALYAKMSELAGMIFNREI